MDFTKGEVLAKATMWLGISAGLGVIYVISICVYRLYFHPLSKIPGPLFGRISNLYGGYHAWTGDFHEDIHRCHVKYGSQVRYAPNRVLFNSASGFKDIYGHQSNVIKSDVYNQMVHRAPNLVTLRDKALHGVRRRILSQGFSESALRGFEPAILTQIEKFTKKISPVGDKGNGKWSTVWNMSRECEYLAFDMMADIVFSRSYNAIEKPDYQHIPQAIEGSNVRVSVLVQAAELRFWRLDKKLFPASIKARDSFVKFQKSDYKDILSLVQNVHDPETGEKFTTNEIAAESATLVVAGSDTTSTTLAALLFYLSRNTDAYNLATSEIRSTFTSLSEIRAGPKLNSCVYLRACLDETLRAAPPAGGSLWREVGSGGAIIDGVPIPAGFDVGTGVYAMHHNAAYYPEPDVWRPQRWLKGTEARIDTGVAPYGPFGVGPRSCIGKPLAYLELMLTASVLLWKFEFRDEDERFHSGKINDKEECEFKLRDHITGAKNGPMLQFSFREGI
ncbi:cytochrome P450 [Bisporella sp. PMI_857]|nr:cytochrome P450 [Bisporella sp. PMI_857]